jgi:hypothetical protein
MSLSIHSCFPSSRRLDAESGECLRCLDTRAGAVFLVGQVTPTPAIAEVGKGKAHRDVGGLARDCSKRVAPRGRPKVQQLRVKLLPATSRPIETQHALWNYPRMLGTRRGIGRGDLLSHLAYLHPSRNWGRNLGRVFPVAVGGFLDRCKWDNRDRSPLGHDRGALYVLIRIKTRFDGRWRGPGATYLLGAG